MGNRVGNSGSVVQCSSQEVRKREAEMPSCGLVAVTANVVMNRDTVDMQGMAQCFNSTPTGKKRETGMPSIETGTFTAKERGGWIGLGRDGSAI